MGFILKLKTSLGYVFQTLKMGWNIAPKEMVGQSLLKALEVPIPLVQAYLAKLIMDEVALSIKGSTGNLNNIFWYVFLEFMLIVLPKFLSLLEKRLNNEFKYKIELSYKQKFLNKLLNLEMFYFEDPKIQNEIYEMKNKGSDEVSKILNTAFDIITGLVLIFSFFGLLLTHNIYIALVLVVITMFSFKNNYNNSKEHISLVKDNRILYRGSWYYEHLLESGTTAKEIKSLNVGQSIYDKVLDQKQKLHIKEKDLDYKIDKKDTIWSVLSSSLYYLSYAWVIFQTVKGVFSLGDMTMFLVLFSKASSGLEKIFSSLVKFYEIHSGLKTIYNFWSLNEENQIPLEPESFEKVIKNPEICFDQVSFLYPHSQEKVINNLSLKIKSGEKIALVGENGAGKSTLIKLILRIYHPTSGKITIGGVDLEKFSRSQIKDVMGVVFQDFLKINSTIKENVMLGNMSADSEEFKESTVKSGLDEIIDSLPKKEDQYVSKFFKEEGVELSGGQWQRVALSRAFIQRGQILILDEPTSAIDANQEHEIFNKFQDLTKGKTSILVSHRFSTVRMADKIIFLEKGQIKEEGTHEELMKKNGDYAQMFNKQAQGYR